jgi:D-alanyl-D-alanine carboxypeptidase
VFARARREYPADPGVSPLVVKVTVQPPVPVAPVVVVPTKKKRR